MPEEVKFNLQSFLSEMRSEQNDRFNGLETKIDQAVTKVNEHETRIVVVENTRRAVKWLGATVVGALIVGLVDLVFTHLPRLMAAGK